MEALVRVLLGFFLLCSAFLYADYDLIVIGGGVGGYTAAITASEKGLKVALIEKAKLGGIAIHGGCIPTQTMLYDAKKFAEAKENYLIGILPKEISFNYSSMLSRKNKVVDHLEEEMQALIQKNSNISYFKGAARVLSSTSVKVNGEILEGKNLVIATGTIASQNEKLPVDNKKVFDEAIVDNNPVIPKRLVIIGAGVAGCQFASLYNALGSKVTLINQSDTLLSWLGNDLSKSLVDSLEKSGIKLITGTSVLNLQEHNDNLILTLSTQEIIETDQVLLAIGRSPNTTGIGLESLDIKLTKSNAIVVNDRMQSSHPHIYAVGDAINRPQLASLAILEGRTAALNAAGIDSLMQFELIPSTIFTEPEVSFVGLNPEKAREKGLEILQEKTFYKELPISSIQNNDEGFASLIVDAKTGKLLGASCLGNGGASQIMQIALALQKNATLQDILAVPAVYPTYSDVWQNLALKLLPKIHKES